MSNFSIRELKYGCEICAFTIFRFNAQIACCAALTLSLCNTNRNIFTVFSKIEIFSVFLPSIEETYKKFNSSFAEASGLSVYPYILSV